MLNFLELLKSHQKLRYQKILVTKQYVKMRYKALKEISDINNVNITNHERYKIKKNILTESFLLKTLNYKNTFKEKSILLKLYKKFNYSLRLKKIYDLKLIKLTNENENLNCYVYLGNHIINFKEVNDLQKLNTILKINDITLIKFNNHNHIDLIPYIKKNILFEKLIVKKYAKKAINYSF